MVHRIYPAELQLNKANASYTEAAFLDLNLSIHNDIVYTTSSPKGNDAHLSDYTKREMETSIFQTLKGS